MRSYRIFTIRGRQEGNKVVSDGGITYDLIYSYGYSEGYYQLLEDGGRYKLLKVIYKIK